MKASITAVGHFLPEKKLTNKELEKMLDTTDEWIYSRCGIKERRISQNQPTSVLAINAFRNMQSKFDVNPEEIDLIILGTLSPDRVFPSTACTVQHAIGAKNAAAFDIMAACSSFVYGLDMGNKFIQSGQYKKVLVIGSDNTTAFINFQDRATAILFGDGAGCAILEPSEEYGIIDSILRADGSGVDYLGIPAGGSYMTASEETVKSKKHFFVQDGQAVFKEAVKGMATVSVDILEKNSLTGDDIRWLVPHQANIRIIDATAKKCNIPDERVFKKLENIGNTCAGTIPVCISAGYDEGKFQKDDILLTVAFGGGFAWGANLIKWEIAKK